MTISQTGRIIVNTGSIINRQSWQRPNKSTFSTGPNGERIPIVKGAPTDYPIADSDYVVMKQIAGTDGAEPKVFTFPYRPLPISHDGYGPTFNEIIRPFDIPILDISSGKLRRFNFDAPLSMQYDSIANTIDGHVSRLHEMADDGIPVRFEAMGDQVTGTNWFIESVSFEQERSAVAGKALKVTARMSLVEYRTYDVRFVYLRPFFYGVPPKGSARTSDKADGAPGGTDVPPSSELSVKWTT